MSNVAPNNVNQQQQSSSQQKTRLETHEVKPIKQTWIPYSQSPLEYQKLGLKPTEFPDEWNRDTKTKIIKEKYTRKISAIYRMRTDDDNQWLNWHEQREGKTPMQRKIKFDAPNMGKKKMPIPNEEIQFDLETEEYNTVITGEKEYNQVYFIPFSQEALAELLEDINPYKTAYYMGHQGQRVFTVTKQEIQQKDFAKVYDSKDSIQYRTSSSSPTPR